jgi:signal transduction histidine kinase
MKITLKLILSFVLVSLAAIGLAACFVGITTSIKFDQYLSDQRQAAFVNAVREYYAENGNWSGVEIELRKQGLLPPEAAPGTKPPDPQPYALVNLDRVVIIASGQYEYGQKIQRGVLDKGIGIEVNGLVVGTVLTSGQNPVRNTIEQKYIESVNHSLLIAALGGVAIALMLGILFARSIARPLRELTNAIHAMTGGKLKQSVSVDSKDEIGDLALSFNKLSQELDNSNQLRKQMTADIAHDLRNPLTVLGGYLESIKDGRLSPNEERIAVMQAEVGQLQHLVDELRTLSLAEGGDLKLSTSAINPTDILTACFNSFQDLANSHQIQLTSHPDPALENYTIQLDSDRMQQVLDNLVSNALHHTHSGGNIQLSEWIEGDFLVIEVKDNGSGIAPDILPYIFERSYRGDLARSGEGSGLGLAIARSLVELHKGTISVESTKGVGTSFRIRLPGLEKAVNPSQDKP